VIILPNAEPNIIPVTIEQLGISYENVLLLLQQHLRVFIYKFYLIRLNNTR